MAYEEKVRTARPHSIIIEERAKISVTGVDEVERFDEDEIVMLTVKGALTVRGSGLHIGRLNLEAGEVTIDGLVTDVDYEETTASGSLWSRLFG